MDAINADANYFTIVGVKPGRWSHLIAKSVAAVRLAFFMPSDTRGRGREWLAFDAPDSDPVGHAVDIAAMRPKDYQRILRSG